MDALRRLRDAVAAEGEALSKRIDDAAAKAPQEGATRRAAASRRARATRAHAAAGRVALQRLDPLRRARRP